MPLLRAALLSEFASWDLVERLPELMASRARVCSANPMPSRLLNGTDHVVIAPTGASLYSALMIAEMARSVSSVPVVISRGFDVPSWVGSRTLYIAVSKSGRDEELIYSLAAAGDQGAKCIVISGGSSSGSHLHEMACAQGYPEYSLTEEEDHPVLEIAGTFAALWCAISVLARWSVTELETIEPILTSQRDLMSDGSENNPANLIAGVLKGKTSHLYGSTGICSAASEVWSYLLHRATGKPAFHDSFPGVDEGPDLVNFGLEMPTDAVLLLLRDSADDPLVRERIDRWITAATAGSLRGRLHEIIAEGATPIERLWSTVHLGMWTACWSATMT